jgi:hypothetical protein
VIGSPFGAAGLDSVLNEIANIRASKEAKKNITYYQYSRKSKSKVVMTDTFKRLLLLNQY